VSRHSSVLTSADRPHADAIAGLPDAPAQESKQEAYPEPTKNARSEAQDPDATMDSPPPHNAANKRSRSPAWPKSLSPVEAKRQSKGKAKADADMDDSATEESDDEKELAKPAEEGEEQVHRPASKVGRRTAIRMNFC
jgi:hypothetical protein